MARTVRTGWLSGRIGRGAASRVGLRSPHYACAGHARSTGLPIYSGQEEHVGPLLRSMGRTISSCGKTSSWPSRLVPRAARVTPSGTVLDPAAIRISSGYAASPAVASGGTNSLIVWLGENPDGGRYGLYGRRINPSGAVLDPNPIAIFSSTATYANEPAVAFDGTNYLVAWSDSGSREYLRHPSKPCWNCARSRRDSDLRRSGADGEAHDAFGGANYLVAWEDTRFGCCSIYGTRVSPAGCVLDPGGIAIATRGREQWAHRGLRRHELSRRVGG